jgi:hypothetical protein
LIVLADRGQKHLADAKNVLICMAVKSLCNNEGDTTKTILVEGVDPKNIQHLQRAGASEIVSAEDFSLKLLAQSALNPGLSTVYERLLTISAESNEIYLEPVPPGFLGKSFTETSRILDSTRSTENPVLALGVVRDGQITINPRNGVFDAFREGDGLVMIAWEQPELAERFAS